MFEMTIIENEYLERNNVRANRRKNNRNKAARKQHISKAVYGFDWYRKSIHEYSKNKIHCSCPMCRYRSIYEPNNMPIQDKKRIIDMQQQILDIA